MTAELPRLFLVLPRANDLADAPACLAAFHAAAAVASLLLPPAEADAEQSLQLLTRQAQELGVAVLAPDDAALARRLGTDGVHLSSADARMVRRLRGEMGDEIILGACCPAQRHAAMELGEAGVDYLGVDQRVEARGENLLAWWAEMFTIPVVAMHPVPPDRLADVCALGADFVVPEPVMWDNMQQAKEAGRAWHDALARLA